MNKPAPIPAHHLMSDALRDMLTEEEQARNLRRMLRSWFLSYTIQLAEGVENEQSASMNVWAYETLDTYLDNLITVLAKAPVKP